MKASFVIVNYNRKDELLVTISKTKEQINNDFDNYEIIIVDNGSVDHSAAAVRAEHPEVMVIENKVNMGAPAWNIGFAKATGDYFIILDDDSHMESGLEEALDFLNTHKEVGVLALNITGGAYNTQTSEWIDLQETAGFIGCGFMLQRELYNKIGGYADWIFLYTNEWDYGIRTLDAGYKIVYFKSCRVIHRTSTSHRTNKRLLVFSARNEMAVVYKHFSRSTRSFYIQRVFLNNLKGIFKYGLQSVSWYFEALQEFSRLKKTLVHTPVKKEVEEFYAKRFWSTQPFFSFLSTKSKT